MAREGAAGGATCATREEKALGTATIYASRPGHRFADEAEVFTRRQHPLCILPLQSLVSFFVCLGGCLPIPGLPIPPLSLLSSLSVFLFTAFLFRSSVCASLPVLFLGMFGY